MGLGSEAGVVVGGRLRLGRTADEEEGVGYETPLLSLTRLLTSIGGGGVDIVSGGGGSGVWRCGARDIAMGKEGSTAFVGGKKVRVMSWR